MRLSLIKNTMNTIKNKMYKNKVSQSKMLTIGIAYLYIIYTLLYTLRCLYYIILNLIKYCANLNCMIRIITMYAPLKIIKYIMSYYYLYVQA